MIRGLLRVGYSDIKNKLLYGRIAPVYCERIWLSPAECTIAIDDGAKIIHGFGPFFPGQVIDYWPPAEEKNIIPVIEVKKIKFSIDHWVNGVKWENTGAYEYMEILIAKSKRGIVDGCRTADDIVRRYSKLDEIFNQVKKEGRLRTKREIKEDKNFRERDGIRIHVGPNGAFILDGGYHRFAMALILNLKMIPAQVTCVHKDAIPSLPSLRKGNRGARGRKKGR